MLLDVSNVGGEHASLDELQELREALQLAGCKRYSSLCVQRNGLSTLNVTASLAMMLQHVTSLTAAFNRINTLQGLESFQSLQVIDLRHNMLRVLDAHSTSLLRRLRWLQRCDFSHNELRFIDFDVPSCRSAERNDLATDSGVSPSATSSLNRLVSLNLAHNELIDVPDLRCMPMLAELDLEYNRIESITDLENRLPLLALTSLSMGHNLLGTLHAMVPLTVLAETLSTLTVRGNPYLQENTATKDFVRPWILWLLPHIERIDDKPISPQERQTAAQLFRHHGKLSNEAIELMNTQHGAQLEMYLKKFTPSPKRNPLIDSFPVEPVDASPNGNFCYPGSAISGMRDRLPSTVSFDGSVVKATSRPLPTEHAIQIMQKKLKRLSSITEVLWRESMKRRLLATIVLQKYFRGFLTRCHLPPGIRHEFARIRKRLRTLWERSLCVRRGLAPASYSPAHGAGRFDSNDEKMNNESTVATMMMQMKRFEMQLHQLSEEMDDFRRIQKRRENAAAITIQKHYRGHIDRRRWRFLKECYDRFVASLLPDITALQRVGRGHLARHQLAHRRARECEVQLLRAEVNELRRMVLEIQEGMRRQRLNRYADPECAMRDIISRHAAPQATTTTATTSAAAAVAAAAVAVATGGSPATSDAGAIIALEGTATTGAEYAELKKIADLIESSVTPPRASAPFVLGTRCADRFSDCHFQAAQHNQKSKE